MEYPIVIEKVLVSPPHVLPRFCFVIHVFSNLYIKNLDSFQQKKYVRQKNSNLFSESTWRDWGLMILKIYIEKYVFCL